MAILLFLLLIPRGFFPSSIAMATKENITFQRGMLKSIQTRVTTLASILLALKLILPLLHMTLCSINNFCAVSTALSLDKRLKRSYH